MIERFSIRNFQCHERFDVELDPLVTVFTGPSDRGKTAILRALRLICTNKPSGTAFIRNGADKFLGRLDVDGQTIQRLRSDSVNKYRLGSKVYAAFGAGKVPEAIENLLNVGEVNFQRQLDPHYWFHHKPAELSKALNSVVNLTAIDGALTNVAAELRRAKAVADVSADRLAKAQAAKKETEWIEDCDQDLHRLEKAESDLKSLQSSNDHLYELLIQLRAADKAAKRDVPNIEALDRQRAKADAFAESNRGLKCLLDDLADAEETICLLQESLETGQDMLAKMVKDGVACQTCGQELSPSSLRTSTLATLPRPHGTPKKTGTRRRSDTSINSTPW